MTQRRPRRKPGENRERLLEAGLIEFGLFGYHGASTSAIAARAGVPQPHVYASFATKRELFLACCSRTLGEPGPPSPGSESSPVDDVRGRLILQAFAASRDPQLRDALQPLLSRLTAEAGGGALPDTLAVAAEGLLGGEGLPEVS